MLLAAVLAVLIPTQGTPPQDSLIGKGQGLNHVTIFVRDMALAQKTFGEVLGFEVHHFGKFPQGWENAGVRFSDSTYLELAAAYDQEKVKGTDEEKYLEKGEGCQSFGIDTDSAEETARRLKTSGFDTKIVVYPEPKPGSKNKAYFWKTVEFPSGAEPSGMFFIHCGGPQLTLKLKPQPNLAVSLKSVWIAVKSVKDADRRYQKMGYVRSAGFHSKALGCRGSVYRVGLGTMYVVEARGKGPTANALKLREGIMGLSVGVSDIAKSKAEIESRSHKNLAACDGFGTTAYLMPPESTNGTLIAITGS